MPIAVCSSHPEQRYLSPRTWGTGAGAVVFVFRPSCGLLRPVGLTAKRTGPTFV